MGFADFFKTASDTIGGDLLGRFAGPWIDEINAKALGVPSPNKPGAQELAAMDRMFPGTNPWERLGGGGGGQGAAATANNVARRNADVQAAIQRRTVNEQTKLGRDRIAADKEIAGITAKAQVDSALVNAGQTPSGGPTPYQRRGQDLDALRVEYDRIRTDNDARRTIGLIDKMSAEAKNQLAQSLLAGDQAAVQRQLQRLHGAAAGIEEYRLGRQDELVDAEVSRSLTNLVTASDNFPSQIAAWLGAIGLGWLAKHYLAERGKRAERAHRSIEREADRQQSSRERQADRDHRDRFGRQPDGVRHWRRRQMQNFRRAWRRR